MERWEEGRDVELSESLGPLLLRVRRRSGRSQLRLAEQLCAVSGVPTVSRHEISRWEREERIPSPFWLAWLGEVLGIAAAQLERATARTRHRRAAIQRLGVASTGSVDGPAIPWRIIEMRRVEGGNGAVGLQTVRPVPAALAGESV